MAIGLTPEQIRAGQENSAFKDAFQAAVKTIFPPSMMVTALDWGAGRTVHTTGPFDNLFRYGKVIAYDPDADLEEYQRVPEEVKRAMPLWVNKLPDPRWQIHFIGFHFSLHHIQESLEYVLAEAKRYRPLDIAIADYDYKRVTRKEFVQTFIAQTEQDELNKQFGGDIQACYNFHRRLGIRDYEATLRAIDMKITQRGFGQGAARHKFFLISQ